MYVYRIFDVPASTFMYNSPIAFCFNTNLIVHLFRRLQLIRNTANENFKLFLTTNHAATGFILETLKVKVSYLVKCFLGNEFLHDLQRWCAHEMC